MCAMNKTAPKAQEQSNNPTLSPISTSDAENNIWNKSVPEPNTSRESKPKKYSIKSTRFVFVRLLLPGQGGLNPCLCFVFCCGGTCTLQYGCVLVGILQIVGGLVETFVYGMMLIFYQTPLLLQYPKSMRNLTDQDVLRIDSLNYTSYAFLLSSAILFSLFSGIILSYAACKINKNLTMLYCVLMGLAIAFGIGTASYCTYLASMIKFRNVNVAEARNTLYFRIWSAFFTIFSFRSYFLACAIGFYSQIVNGEYLLPPDLAAEHRRTSLGDGRNPLMPKPPLLPMPPQYPSQFSNDKLSFHKDNFSTGYRSISSESPTHDD